MRCSTSFPSSSLRNKNKAFQYINIWRKLESRRCSKCRLRTSIIAGIVLIMLINEEGKKLVIHIRETDITKRFSYPMDLDNFSTVVNRFRLGILDQEYIKPINLRYANIDFLVNSIHPEDVDSPVGLLIIVKSATRNYEKRESIRKSWGAPEYLKNTSLSSTLPTKLYFICGIPQDSVPGKQLFPDEGRFRDIILANFDDNYSNNTYKSILALKWATTEFPSYYQYLLLIDDDMYLNLENMIPFVRTLKNQKVYSQNDKHSSLPLFSLSKTYDGLESKSTPELYDQANGLYMGMAYGSAYPIRRRPHISNFLYAGTKWYVSLEEYPLNLYPPYVPGAAIFMAKKTVSDLYYASYFVEHFWIDDVYLGILAYKMGIRPLDVPYFNSDIHGLQLMDEGNFAEAMTIHGFSCPAQMFNLWHSRRLDKAKAHFC